MTDVIAITWYVFIDYETHTIYVSQRLFNGDDPHFDTYTEAIEYADQQAEVLGYEVIPF